MRTYRRCAEEYRRRYVEGLVPLGEKAAPLRVGTATHAGLEARAKARMAGSRDGWEAVEAELSKPPADLANALDPYDAQLVRELLRGYCVRWADEDVEYVAVEAEFEAPHTNPETGGVSRTWQHAGKMDGVVRVGGRLLLLEHKTTSQDIGPGSTYWQALLLDPQVTLYFAGARALGHEVEGCLYDVIGKPKVRPLRATPPEARKYTKAGTLYAGQRETDESPEEYGARVREELAAHPDRYYQRGEVVRLERDEQAFAFDAWATGRQIADSMRLGRWPKNPDSCFKWGRPCEYFGVCTGTEADDDPTRWTRSGEWKHPELSARAETASVTSDKEDA
jgi:hypothetical protein